MTFAGDGPEALLKAAEVRSDGILLDVMMSGMTGFEVCQHRRADPMLAEVPILMITALDDQQAYLQGLECGADDFITKPFDRLRLQARVKTITRLNRSRRLLAERARLDWVVEQTDDAYVVLTEEDSSRYTKPQARLYLGLTADIKEDEVRSFLEIVATQTTRSLGQLA